VKVALIQRAQAQRRLGTGRYVRQSESCDSSPHFNLRRTQWTEPLGAFRHIVLIILTLGSLSVEAQANLSPRTNSEPNSSNVSPTVREEQLRAQCLEGRRCVCGRVLKVFANGVLVESGYPSLLRAALHGAWHLPGTVVASRPSNLVETQEPDSICVGVVFLTDLPKLRGGKSEHIKPYDYVVLHSYPAGHYTYNSVGNIEHTVRRFSGGLETAVKLILTAEKINTAVVPK
jgi:hypothetical protein